MKDKTMKTIKNVLIATLLLFSLNASAHKVTKNMLEQIANINSFWRPIVGNSVYVVKKEALTIVIIRLYDYNKQDGDPEIDDVQVIFVKSDKTCKLYAVVFSSVDRIIKNIELLVP